MANKRLFDVLKYIFLALTVICAIILGAGVYALAAALAEGAFSAASEGAASIGVIGGADGPTAIYVTSAIPPSLMIALTIVFAVLTIVFFVLSYRNKDRGA